MLEQVGVLATAVPQGGDDEAGQKGAVVGVKSLRRQQNMEGTAHGDTGSGVPSSFFSTHIGLPPTWTC